MGQDNSESNVMTKSGYVVLGNNDKTPDYSTCVEGQLEPSSGKMIKEIIMNDVEYIVFLTDECELEWSAWKEKADEIDVKVFSKVVSAVPELESRSKRMESDEKQKYGVISQQELEIKTLLGAVLVSMFEKAEPAVIDEKLKKAETYLAERMTEKARQWYLTTAALVTGMAVLGIIIVALLRTNIIGFIGETGYDVLLGMGMGGIGAFIFVLMRTDKLFVSQLARRSIHRLEAGARIIVGALGGLLVALAIKSEIFFSMFNSVSHPLVVLLVICTVAGISERIVPGLVEKVETTAQAKATTDNQ